MRYVGNIEDFRKKGGCIFCEKPAAGDDGANYIVFRGEYVFAMLNAFPYNTGHLMISPFRHVADIEQLTTNEYCEMMSMAILATRAIKEEFACQGLNIGINLGKIAGAGIADHLHMHLVPRWDGDTNFMPVVADTKVMPETLDQTYARLKRAIAGLAETA